MSGGKNNNFRSAITPLKHQLLKKVIGREAGTFDRLTFRHDRLILLDLMAGAGPDPGEPWYADDEPWYFNCSPGLMAYHALVPAYQGHEVHVILHENSYLSRESLLGWLDLLPEIENRYARGARWVQTGEFAWACRNARLTLKRNSNYIHEYRPYDVVFALHDPASVGSVSERDTLLSIINTGRSVSMMHSLGFNAGGVKRLAAHPDAAIREQWFAKIDTLRDVVRRAPAHHIPVMVALSADHQWTYLLTAPQRWLERTKHDFVQVFGDQSVRFAGYGRGNVLRELGLLSKTAKQLP